jgi:RNA polymerase sigma factor (TIGR02999 family)
MPMSSKPDPISHVISQDGITCCLKQLQLGEAGAEERLLTLVYNQLRKMAGQRMRRERIDHTLQATALANEVWVKLARTARGTNWVDSNHFFATCGRIMRNLLVDSARRRKFEKVDVELLPGVLITEQRSEELLALDAAFERLARFDPRGARVVELIAIVGLTQQETARVLGMSDRTVKRDYAACRMWLRDQLKSSRAPTAPPAQPDPETRAAAANA